MSIRKVQSFPNLESFTSSPPPIQLDQSFAPKPEDLLELQGSRIPADHLFKILDGSMLAQKMGMKLAMDAINPTSGNNSSDMKLINCFLNSTTLLLDACNNIKLRLESIRTCLDSISTGLYYLESEPEPNKTILQQAATALESGRFRDKRHHTKMEKIMSRMRTFNEKLNNYAQLNNEISSLKLHKAMRGSLAMGVFAVGVLSSATSIKSFTNPSAHDVKVEPRTILLLNEPSNKTKIFQKKVERTASMEELASTDLTSQTLLKLLSAWQKGGSSSLRRMAVKAVAGELRRRKLVLEKTLPLLEDKIEEFCQQIVAIRIGMFGLLPKAKEEVEMEMVKNYSYEESQVKKASVPSCSLGRIRPPRCIGFIKNTRPLNL